MFLALFKFSSREEILCRRSLTHAKSRIGFCVSPRQQKRNLHRSKLGRDYLSLILPYRHMHFTFYIFTFYIFNFPNFHWQQGCEQTLALFIGKQHFALRHVAIKRYILCPPFASTSCYVHYLPRQSNLISLTQELYLEITFLQA